MKKLRPVNDPHYPYQSMINFLLITVSMLFLMYLGDCLGQYFSWMEHNARYLKGQQITEIFR